MNTPGGPRRPVKTKIPGELARIDEASRFVRQVVSGVALSDQRASDLEAAVSEACAIAIKHSGHGVELAVWVLRDRVVVEISGRGGYGVDFTEAGQRRRPLDLSLLIALADQVQISRISDRLNRISLAFLLDAARSGRRPSSASPGATQKESERERLLEDPRVHGRVLTPTEVRRRKAIEGDLRSQAFRDPLTGLANRALFFDRLGTALSRADRCGSSVAVALLDLDDFKVVNDSLGHAAGDRLLVEVSERLTRQLRAEDTAARLGGDEFALVVEEGTDPGTTARVIGRTLARLHAPYSHAGGDMRVGVSVGVAVRYPHGCGPEELLQRADFALYAAKAAGKNCFKLFESGMSAPSVARLELQMELERALESGEIVSHYQPILSTSTGAIMGIEALCRWKHPRRGLLAPRDFLPIAEETGLIVPLGDLVLRQACDCLRQWDALHPGSGLWLAVNLCSRQLREPRMINALITTLADSNLGPGRLVLDISENVFTPTGAHLLENLATAREAGIGLAIDDFGAGCSSLTLLGAHPVDMLKMTKGFVDTLGDSPGGDVLAGAVMGLARHLGAQVVAEGIERREQLQTLSELGCDMWQGWHFSPAVESSQLLALAGEGAV